jgi:glycosyltransferase involved in cell wall biosynthesis
LQTLNTAEALAKRLGKDFVLAAHSVTPSPLYTHRAVNFSAVRSFVLAWKQMRFARREHVDVLFCREYHLLFFLIVYNRFLFRIPLRYVYEAHDIYNGFRFNFVLRRCDHVICTNTYILQTLTARVPHLRASVLPNGVDLTRFAIDCSRKEARALLGIPEDWRVLVYTGRYYTEGQEKGIPEILEAVARLHDQSVHFFAVGGTAEEVAAHRVMAEKKGLSHMAHFVEYVEQKELAIYQKAADALIMYFPDLPHYRTNMSPIKMFEYMASERPIITSDLPSVRDVLNEENAFFAPAGDTSSLAKTIRTVFSSRAESERKAHTAYLAAQGYSWEARASAIVSVFKEIRDSRINI